MTGLQWLKRKRQEPEKVISEEKQVEDEPTFEPLIYSMDGDTYYLNMRKYTELHDEDSEKASQIFDELMGGDHKLVMAFD